MEKWQEIALNLHNGGMSHKQVWLEVNKQLGLDFSFEKVRHWLWMREKQAKKLGVEITPEVYKNTASRTPKTAPTKNVVVENLTPEITKDPWDGCETIIFGVVSDNHASSTCTQWSLLHDFYDICASRGVNTVYHAGDITDGIKMRPGHEYELYHSASDDQIQDVIDNYPCVEGITTKFITGNHDVSLFKLCGSRVGPRIAAKRPDMIYLGADDAIVELTPNCKLELRHPWDGTAYALSYKPQKMIEAMEGGTKPNILIIGNYHKAEYLFYRNIHCLQAGCFQAQTNFMRGKGISAHVGGWIVTVTVDKDGTIRRFAPEFIPFYKTDTNDYKKWFKLY